MSGKRYQIKEKLGAGGMGTVYRALDRMTDTHVALKQVHASTIKINISELRMADTVNIGAIGASTHDRLVLAREFRVLASLRHPNIISVLDYGFDDDLQPYYTMEIMDHPRTILQEGRDQPLETQIDLLIQMLHALEYLHRRGVIHLDVKPSNVLVEDHQVRLLDFGISELRGSERFTGVSGSIPYLAPEILQELPVTEAADLYALGVIAYEMMAGHHPYAGDPVSVILEKAVNEVPVISTQDFDARVIPILQRLLAKAPGDRYRDATEVIHALTQAIGRPLPQETSAIRESFLQAAGLVGRDAEMEQLTALVKAAIEGRGGTVLIAGESGVGKTRLVEELRNVCLVEGALVLNGQAVSSGASPYQMWREVLRWLCLLVDLSDTAAAVLKPQVPDIEELVGRPVGDAPELDPQAAQQRFLVTVENLFGKLDQPVVVIVEDLQWAGDASLTLLAQLEQILRQLPILLVGTYRQEERADILQDLSNATRLHLPRLDAEAIAELAESMLGPVGREPHILELLQRETEGNAFFVVEVVRALAEEAGRLEDVDPNDLPEHISTGGIDRIIRRRLNRVPEQDRALLRLAAVLGREIDLKLLWHLEPDQDLDRWLKSCADSAVLDVQGGQWRLINDRLRQRLLQDTPAAGLRSAHRRAAEAVFSVYGDAAIDALAHHWSEAADVGDPEATERATTYLQRAGRAAMASCSNREAIQHLSRSLQLLGTLASTPDRQRLEICIQVDLGGTYLMSKGFTAPEVGQAFGRARSLCEQTGETEELMPALLGLWRFHIVRGELDITQRLAEEMIAHAKAHSSTQHLMLARYALGTTFLFQGHPEPSSGEFDECLKLYENLQAESQQALAAAAFFLGQNPGVAAYSYSGWAQWCLGNPDTALERVHHGLALADRLGHAFSQAFARTLVAWLEVFRNDDRAAEAAAGKAIALCKEQGFPYFLAVSSIFHGWARARRGEVQEGIGQINKVLEGLRAAGSELFRPFFLALLAEVYGLAKQPEDGLAAIDEALEDVDGRGGGWWEPEIFRVRGELYLMQANPDRELAENAFLRSLHRARWRKERALELRATMSLARLWADDELRQTKARSTLENLCDTYTEGFETPDFIAAKSLLQDAT